MPKIKSHADGTFSFDYIYRPIKGTSFHLKRDGLKTELAASRLASQLEAERKATASTRKKGNGFEDLAEKFMKFEMTRKRMGSFDGERRLLINHMGERWHGKTISAVFSEQSLRDFRSYVSGLKVQMARKNRILSRMLSLSEWAYVNSAIDSDQRKRSMSILTKFRNDSEEVHKEKIALTKEEYRLFISTFAATDRYKAMFELWFYFGCRIGELMGLQWKDVDFAKSTVFIHKQNQRNSATKEWMIVPTKSKRGKRTLHLTEEKMAVVKLLKESLGSECADDDFLFFGRTAITNTPITVKLKRHCVKAGIPIISPHEIRHTVGTWIGESCQSFGDVVQGAEWFGDTPSVFQNVYCHAMGGSSKISEALKA